MDEEKREEEDFFSSFTLRTTTNNIETSRNVENKVKLSGLKELFLFFLNLHFVNEAIIWKINLLLQD